MDESCPGRHGRMSSGMCDLRVVPAGHRHVVWIWETDRRNPAGARREGVDRPPAQRAVGGVPRWVRGAPSRTVHRVYGQPGYQLVAAASGRTGLALYRDGISTEWCGQIEQLACPPFNHPPFMIQVLGGWAFLAHVSGLPF